jgi:hypothetical protein
MSTKARALIGALIVCLILVPALVRATRTFDPGPRPRLAPSFNKSFDVPPAAAAIPADATVPVRLLEPAGVALVPPVPAVSPRLQPGIDPLRGPPARFRS